MLSLLVGSLWVGTPSARAVVDGSRPFVADPMATWQTDGTVFALASVGDVIYVGGRFSSVRPPDSGARAVTVPRSNFAAFDARTGDLLSCAPEVTKGGDAAEASIRALTASPDGSTLYAGGSFNSVAGTAVANVAAISLPDCSPRQPFPRANGAVHAIATADSAVYIGGDFTKVKGQTRTRLAAISPRGALLPWVPSADRTVHALTVAPGTTRVYAGGQFGVVDGQSISGLVALDPSSGSVVQSFPGWIDTRNQDVRTLAHDDTYVYLGSEGTGPGVFDGRIAADVQTGAMHWRDNCLGATQAVLPYQGLLYSASHAHDCHTQAGGFPDQAMQGRQHFLAETIDGAEITPWFPDTDEGPGGHGVGPYALAVGDGILWAGGMFTKVNGKAQQGLTRFPSAPDTGAPAVVAQPTATDIGSHQVRVTWPSSWDRDDGTLEYSLYRVGVAAPVAVVSGSSRYWDRPTVSAVEADVPVGTQQYEVAVSDGAHTSARSPVATVEVSDAPVDLVLGSATSQSSTYEGASAARAADAGTDGDYHNGSVTHTGYDTYAWWQTDLGQVRNLTRVVLWNRTDCCSTRLGNFDVFFSANPFTSTDPRVTSQQVGVTTVHVSASPNPSVTLTGSVAARYLRVQLGGRDYLSLAEVQAYG